MQVTLSHYRIVEESGAGGMGVVYRAHDERLDRDVALKVLPAGALADESARKRFHKEALALSKLNHPNIATVFDFDTQDGTDFLVEEVIEGLPLDKMLISAPLAEREIVNLGVQLCEGLAAAHEQGVIHRDLKPQNIGVTPKGRLKILDFGLAKTTSRVGPSGPTASLTETQTVSGTVPYMAPEQLLNSKPDARTDIWAAGCVLYEMATGQRAFPGSGPALIDAILHRSPVPASRLNRNMSAGLEAILLKCLEKDPELRYASAHDVAVDLGRLVSSSSAIPVAPRLRQGRTRRVAILAALVAVLALAAVIAWRITHRRPAGSVAQPSQFTPSIAVLPFVNMSADKDQEYFSDGLAEELLNVLAKIPELKVTSRSSSFQFKGKNEDLRVIGEKLNVATILEGSVRKQGSRVRITAQLIKVSDGFHLWSETYDRDLTDIFAVQEEIARAVAASLKTTLLAASAPASRTTTPEAYNTLLMAHHFLTLSGIENANKALAYSQKSIQLDPNYAPAWAELARVTVTRSIYTGEVHDTYRQAREAAERALALDPNLASAHVAMGRIKKDYDWEWDGAQASYHRALALEPSNAAAINGAAMVSLILGHCDEALELSRQAVAIDPLRAEEHHVYAYNAWSAGRVDEAEREARKALEIDPEYPWAHYLLGQVYLARSNPQNALSEMGQERHPGFRLQGFALAYAALARKKESDDALHQLIKERELDMAYQIAEVYASRGDSDLAFEWLDRAYGLRDGGLTFIKSDPLLKNIRSDPRFTALLKKMRLPLN